MNPWRSIDTVLDFAIENEAASAAFYSSLAGEVTSESLQAVLLDLVEEELGHKRALEAIRREPRLKTKAREGFALEKEDYLVDLADLVEEANSPEVNMGQLLVVAVAKEKAAYRLYRDLAEQVDDRSIRQLFLRLAQEEARHSRQFQTKLGGRLRQTTNKG